MRTTNLAFSLIFLSLANPIWSAELVEITNDNWKDVCPSGKEADWIFGDYVLRNDKVTLVIANPIESRNANMTVRNVGGSIIDFTFRFRPSDQLSCFYPGAAEFPIRSIKSEETEQGMAVTVASERSESLPDMSVTYELNDGEEHLKVSSKFTNPHDTEVQFSLRDAVRADRGFTHHLEDSLYVCEDLWWRQSYGIQPSEHRLEAVADSLEKGRPILSYAGESGPQISLQSGESYELKRILIPGESRQAVESTARLLNGETLNNVAVVVVDSQGFVSHAHVTIESSGASRSIVAPEAGPLMVKLPVGSHSIAAMGLGRGEQQTTLEVTENAKHIVTRIELRDPAYINGNITDAEGTPIPAKIQFISQEGEDPDFGPDTKSFGVKNLQYTANGRFRTALAPGEYQVIISRGVEYDADFQTITLERGKTTQLDSTLVRSVQTNGWVSADFHSHSTPSGDNTSDQLGRVLNLLAEHIEFAPCTEHNRITSYSPHLTRLKAESFMATCTGMELTGKPLPVSHQNAFPLYHRPHTQDGGGPTTLENPVAQIERLAMWDDGSDKLVQENHPNLEQIWADKDLDGQEDEGFEKNVWLHGCDGSSSAGRYFRCTWNRDRAVR